MFRDNTFMDAIHPDEHTRFEGGYTIPLYTHPVKEQDTDCQYCKQGCIRCDARKQLTDEEIQEVAHGFGAIGWMGDTTYEFARAILRKAQKK
jgi:hypothetical protein